MFDSMDFTKPIVDFSNFEFSQLGDALKFGGTILLIGMAVVFSVLILLWICIAIFKVFFHDIPAKRAKTKVEVPLVTEEHPIIETQVAQDTEIVAVIAAAIAMAESENMGAKFRVVSFKRI